MKNKIVLILIFVLSILISGCSPSSRTSVDPWPGLFRLKETNKKGYEIQKRRNKKLEKQKKKRLNGYHNNTIICFTEEPGLT